MQTVTAPGASARTFLIHMFRRGLDDNRYVVEREIQVDVGRRDRPLALQGQVEDRQTTAPGDVARRRPAHAAGAGRDHRVHRREDHRLRHPVLGIGGDGPVRGAQAQGALSRVPPGMSRRPQAGGRPSPGPQPRKEGTCHTKIPRRNVHAGGGGMNALPPSGSPAACVRGAGRRGPRPIGPCAGIAAKSGPRPSAQDARRPRQLAGFTAAKTRNGAALLRVTGAGGETGRGGTLARARVAVQIHPLKAARCANRAVTVARRDREREQYAMRRAAGLCGRCGTPAPSDAAYCDRCAGSAAKRSRKKAKNARSRQRYVQRRVRRLCIDCGAPWGSRFACACGGARATRRR